MTATRSNRIVAWLLGGLVLVAVPAVGAAQDAPAAPADGAGEDAPSLAKMWEDFVYFVRVAQGPAALSNARALASRAGNTEAEQALYLLAIGTKDVEAQDILRQAGNLDKQLAEPVATIREMIERGYNALRRDPQRIAEAIAKLGQHERAARIGMERLRVSGQYALPQLVQALRDADTSDLARGRIATLLPEMGPEGIRPMAVALQSEDAQLVEVLAGALAQTPYPHAAPRLREALARDDLPARTRQIVRRALVACAGEQAPGLSVGEVFRRTGERYYYRRESLRPPAAADTANVWFWRNRRLEYTPVPRPIFCYVYAMRYARLAV